MLYHISWVKIVVIILCTIFNVSLIFFRRIKTIRMMSIPSETKKELQMRVITTK